MPPDADIQVQRIARAIEKVLRSDGWVNGSKVYDRRHLRKIAEAMSRKSADPSRYVNQGFHNTSLTQCILRQQLEVNPAQVMEMIASLVTSGKAFVGQGQRGRLVVVDPKSLALDLESRWSTDETAGSKGMRDAVGQLFDLLLVQSFWDESSDSNASYVYTQDPRPKVGTTGERLIKVDVATNSRIEVVYEGTKLNIKSAFDLSRMFDEKGSIVAHSSLVGDLNEPSIETPEDLFEAIAAFVRNTGKPPVVMVFAGLLPGGSGSSKGFDLHAVTCLQIEDQFFLESRWGLTFDAYLNGLSASELLAAMEVPELVEGFEDFAIGGAYLRVIDPAYPIPRAARAPQLHVMQRENEQIAEIEKRARNNPVVQAQERYYEELEKWEAKRAEHMAVFGDDLPFKLPPPRPPSTQPT